MFRRMAFILACTLATAALVRAQATQPAEVKAPKPATLSEPARALLDQVRDAYSNLKTLNVEGVVRLSIDAAGERDSKTAKFSGSFQAPTHFRHEMQDDMLVVNDGQKAFLYKIDKDIYITVDAPQERTELSKLADPLVTMLQQQNPSILLAITKDAGASFVDGVESVEKVPDVTVDGMAYPALLLKSGGQEITALIDPKTSLLRQMTIDMRQYLMSHNVPQVNTALMTIDYSKSAVDSPVEAESFAWVPPASATLVKLPPPEEPGQVPGAGEAMALVGQTAPAFELRNLDDQAVSLGDLKGNVVVLDFWATWCGPCVESMPHLNALNNDLSPKGLKVFAVNLREAPALAKKFMEDKKFDLRVLLDSDGKVADLYKVNGIPQTVVIGKDGKIAKVFVGFGPGGEDQLREAVQAAMQ